MDSDDDAREIRQRMAGLRRNLALDAEKLEADVHRVGRNARELTDWRFYVERFPFAAAAAAAAAGYLVVPSKPQVIVPDADTLAKLASSNQVWVKTGRPKAVEKERGLVSGLVALALTAAGRLALNWATQQIKQQVFAGQHETSSADAAETDSRTRTYPPR